jgi:outer membrane murein-binding lipoprotein Lpp
VNVKRFLVVLAVAAVAGATYVATASSSQRAAPTARQFAALKRQVSQLSKKVKSQGVKIGALQTAEKGVKTEADDVVGFLNSCFFSTNAGALPINQFGDPGGTLGYHYQQSTTQGDDVLTSALDVDNSSTPGAFVQVVDPTCVTPSGGLRKMGALADHRAAIHAVAKH